MTETPPASVSLASAIIDRWVADQIQNSPIARATEAYNHLINALVDLKQRLSEEF